MPPGNTILQISTPTLTLSLKLPPQKFSCSIYGKHKQTSRMLIFLFMSDMSIYSVLLHVLWSAFSTHAYCTLSRVGPSANGRADNATLRLECCAKAALAFHFLSFHTEGRLAISVAREVLGLGPAPNGSGNIHNRFILRVDQSKAPMRLPISPL